MKRIIFDLDGTLADINHRRHWVEGPKKYWEEFFEACDKDLPNRYMVWLFKSLQERPDTLLEIWSGRSEKVREKTIDWLALHEIYPINLRMRPENDYTPDEILKKKWLDEMEDEEIFIVFDDRDKVVKMWRDNGILCCQIAPGNF